MPLRVNTDQLINKRIIENNRIEYKSGWNPEPIVHTVSAFANDLDNIGGGYIIIGAEEEDGVLKRPISGIEKNNVDKIQKELINSCRLIEPHYVPAVSHEIIDGADILVVHAYGGSERPYSCPVHIHSKERSERAYYVRRGSNTVRLRSSELKELFSVSEKIPFDDRINTIASVDDLSRSLMTEFLYRIKSGLHRDSKEMPFEDLCSSMEVVRGPREDKRPVNVGLMFFNERPDRFFRYARIEVVDKPDPTGDRMTEKYFYGPLDRQLADAIAYIRNYIVKEITFKHDDRPEASRFFNYPIPAIEEILSNAVYHKGYDVPEPIVVTFTPECMTVTNLPGPDRSITDDDLKNYRLVSLNNRNRRIGDFLKELKFVEGRNTGIPKIIEALDNNGSERPTFKTDERRTYMCVTLPIHKAFLPAAEEKKYKKSKERRLRRTSEDVREDILNILSDGKFVSLLELAERMGHRSVPSSLREHVRTLISERLLEYSNPENLRDPRQKIRLRKE
jgi:ATP-dependent DNA helicase RecG